MANDQTQEQKDFSLFAIIYGIVLLVRAFQFRSLHSV
jgi:hypothetical protein